MEKTATPPQRLSQEEGYRAAQGAVTRAAEILNLCLAGLNDANQSLPCGFDVTCSCGRPAADVYFGVERAMGDLADELKEASRLF